MICIREQERYDNALARLHQLQEELATAPPARKAALVRKIVAQDLVVEEAAAALEECRRRNAPPPPPRSQTEATLVNIRLQSSYPGLHFWEDKRIRRTFRFVLSTTRTFTIDDVDITRTSATRTSVYHLGGFSGTLDPVTGNMTLRATLDLDDNHVPFELHTGSASSSYGNFKVDLTGHPLVGTSVLLVGAALTTTKGETLAYGFEIDVLFDAAP